MNEPAAASVPRSRRSRWSSSPARRTRPSAAGEAIDAFRHYWGTWDEYAIDPVESIDAGPSVVVVVHEHGRGKGSGVPVERQHFQLWTFRRGRIVRWEAFADKARPSKPPGCGS